MASVGGSLQSRPLCITRDAVCREGDKTWRHLACRCDRQAASFVIRDATSDHNMARHADVIGGSFVTSQQDPSSLVWV